MNNPDLSLLFLGAKDNEHCYQALAFCQSNFADFASYLGRWGDAIPAELDNWDGDYIVSYLSRWLVPEYLLAKVRIAAINFHPGPPEYPGVGCTNFALYDQAKEYGVTCHHMASKVDTGSIIAVRRFPILQTDDVASLLERTHSNQLELFNEIMNLIIQKKALPVSTECWTKSPFTRKQLDDLAKITTDMTHDEVVRRIRATTYGAWRPILEHQGFRFKLITDTDTDATSKSGGLGTLQNAK